MEHDGIFNHLRRRLASEGHLADTPSRGMCLHCRSAHLGEYTCHVALIINRRMCQLPPGDGEGKQPAGGSGGPLLRRQSEATITSQQKWWEARATAGAPTANIQRRANWTQLSGAWRAPREAGDPPPIVAHVRCCCSLRATKFGASQQK